MNGSGNILADDFSAVKTQFFKTLPAGDPVAPASPFSNEPLKPFEARPAEDVIS